MFVGCKFVVMRSNECLYVCVNVKVEHTCEKLDFFLVVIFACLVFSEGREGTGCVLSILDVFCEFGLGRTWSFQSV